MILSGVCLALALAAPLRAQTSTMSYTGAGLAVGVLPSVNVSSVLGGDGPVLYKSLPIKIGLLKRLGEPFFVKSRNELFVGYDGRDGHLGGQDRFGLGLKGKRGFYALIGMGDDAEIDRGSFRREATMIFVGPEIGKAFFLGSDGVVYAGATAGYGWQGGTGTHAEGLTCGVTVDGRLGKPDVKGTLRFGANATVYPEAVRASVSADVNVSRKLTLGGGVRALKEPDLDLAYPYARLTYRLGR